MMSISYWTLLAAAAASFIVGALWHGPLFGKWWMKAMGFGRDDMKRMPLSPTQSMAGAFIANVVVAYVMAVFADQFAVFDFASALQLAFWVWLGFQAPLLANGWFWEGKSFKLYAFNAVYALVYLTVIATVVGIWR
jgi:hypothetical protein